MQIKTTMRYYYIPVKLDNKNKLKQLNLKPFWDYLEIRIAFEFIDQIRNIKTILNSIIILLSETQFKRKYFHY